METPPTIYRGLCLFGANDGWVYCLRAADGELAWRFRAAPEDRRIMVAGRLESLWPVPCALVENGVAYVAAGRHSGMDGGIYAWALDAPTGKVVWQKHLVRGGDKISGKLNWSGSYHANDVLVSNGGSIVMGRLLFDAKSGQMTVGGSTQFGKKSAQYLSSGNARSGAGLVPFGFLNNRRNIGQRSSYHKVRYKLTLWTYGRHGGASGMLLAFTKDKIFGVTGKTSGNGAQWQLFAKGGSAWTLSVPAGSVRALLPAGPTLFAAGPGKKGGVLWSYSADAGKKLGELPFDDVPVFDGMAAAGGRLYISTQKGKVFCFGR